MSNHNIHNIFCQWSFLAIQFLCLSKFMSSERVGSFIWGEIGFLFMCKFIYSNYTFSKRIRRPRKDLLSEDIISPAYHSWQHKICRWLYVNGRLKKETARTSRQDSQRKQEKRLVCWFWLAAYQTLRIIKCWNLNTLNIVL